MKINYRTVCDCVRCYRVLREQGYYVNMMCDYKTGIMWCDAHYNRTDYTLYNDIDVFNVAYEYYCRYYTDMDINCYKIYNFLKNYERCMEGV